MTAVCPGPVKTEFFDQVESCVKEKPEDGTKKLKQLKKLVMANPERVVKKALRDNRKGKEVSVYGPIMQMFELACKVIPHKVLLKIMS